MFKWIKSLFKQAQQAQQAQPEIAPKKPEPQPGQRWVLMSGGDPFPAPNGPEVRILEERDGWVRYYMHQGFPDNRMKVADFIRIYQLLEAA